MGHGAESEACGPTRANIEADADRMARADIAATDAKTLAQRIVEAGSQHDKPESKFRRHSRAQWVWRSAPVAIDETLAQKARDRRRNFTAQAVDQRLVEDIALIAGLLVDEPARAGQSETS